MLVSLRLPLATHRVDGLLLREDGEVCLLSRERPGELGLIGLNLYQPEEVVLDTLGRIECASSDGEGLDVRLYTSTLDYSIYRLEPALATTSPQNPAAALAQAPVAQLRFTRAPHLAGVPALLDDDRGLTPAHLTDRGWCQVEPEVGCVVIAGATFHREQHRAWERLAPPAPLGSRQRLSPLAV